MKQDGNKFKFYIMLMQSHFFVVTFFLYNVRLTSAAYYEDLVKRYSKKHGGSFETGYNEYFRGRDYGSIERMMGALIPEDRNSAKLEISQTSIPTSFNSVTQWPNCAATIDHIKDQSDCGSCWAIAASEVMADRTCIGNYNQMSQNSDEVSNMVDMSAEQILSCCSFCGFGCNGGYTIDAMKFWYKEGVVTGGWYGSACGCQPYVIPPCSPKCTWPFGTTPNCTDSCRNGYSKQFAYDKHYASDYYLIESSMEQLQTEIMTHGPIECVYTVYENFMTYKNGVYDKIEGRKMGGHAIKVIGWGESEGTPYWIVNNSWNTTWGINGSFWILRGSNFCGIESYCVAGLAKTGDMDFKLKC